MNEYPTKLELNSAGLLIEWSDGLSRPIAIKALRNACPCATCGERKEAEASKPPNPLAIIDPKEAAPLTIESLRPVGNYGYSIRFSDGHNTGIFKLEFLRGLAEEQS